MIRFLIVIILIILALLVFRNSRKNISNDKPDIYKKIILAVIILAIIFFLATSGKFIIPQILKITKIILPFLTKFIGV